MSSLGPWLAGAATSAALVLAFALFSPLVRASATLAYGVGFVCVCAQISVVAWLRGRVRAQRPALERGFVAALLVLLAFAHGRAQQAGWAALITFALLLAGTSLGAELGRRIVDAGHVLAVVLVSSLVDVWSVCDPAGPSAQLAESVIREPDRLSAFILVFPALGSSAFAPLIGAGDVLFAGVYGAALGRHRVDPVRSLIALFSGLAVGMLLTLWWAHPLPLLPFLGAAVLCTDRRLCSLRPEDRRTVAVSVGLLLIWVAVRIAR